MNEMPPDEMHPLYPEHPLQESKDRADAPSGAAACSASCDFEKGPWSYDLYSDGIEPVALLNNPNHSQGEWVSIEDYRRIERERDELRAVTREAIEALKPHCRKVNPTWAWLMREVLGIIDPQNAEPTRGEKGKP